MIASSAMVPNTVPSTMASVEGCRDVFPVDATPEDAVAFGTTALSDDVGIDIDVGCAGKDEEAAGYVCIIVCGGADTNETRTRTRDNAARSARG